METYLEKQQALDMAEKALKDIGHWEDFKIKRARYFEKDPPYDYNHWLVSFNFTENDWTNGEVPMVIVNDEEGIVTFVSWERSEFLLNYDKEKDKYWHSTLSREQPEY